MFSSLSTRKFKLHLGHTLYFCGWCHSRLKTASHSYLPASPNFFPHIHIYTVPISVCKITNVNLTSRTKISEEVALPDHWGWWQKGEGLWLDLSFGRAVNKRIHWSVLRAVDVSPSPNRAIIHSFSSFHELSLQPSHLLDAMRRDPEKSETTSWLRSQAVSPRMCLSS